MKTLALIPVFHVTDVDEATRFYVERLGFERAFRYGTYVGLKFGGCELHLTIPGDFARPVGGGTAYVICETIDAYYASILASGINPRSPLADRMYGMRDFIVTDPDGNQLTFGCDLHQE